MAWTTPRTWVTDELVTAALMNTHVRDNFNAVPHLLVYKTADESVTSTTTLQDDNHLFYALGANDLWYLNIVLVLYGDAPTPGIRVAFTIPSGATMNLQAEANQASGSHTSNYWVVSGDDTDLITISVGGVIEIQGIVETAVTAGNFQMQWAQQTSSATQVTVKKGSCIFGLQLA